LTSHDSKEPWPEPLLTTPSLVDLIKAPPGTPGRAERLADLAFSHYGIIAAAVREDPLSTQRGQEKTHAFIARHYWTPEDRLLRKYDPNSPDDTGRRRLLRNYVYGCARFESTRGLLDKTQEGGKRRIPRPPEDLLNQKIARVRKVFGRGAEAPRADPDGRRWWVTLALTELGDGSGLDPVEVSIFAQHRGVRIEMRNKWLSWKKLPDTEESRGQFTDRMYFLIKRFEPFLTRVVEASCPNAEEAERELDLLKGLD